MSERFVKRLPKKSGLEQKEVKSQTCGTYRRFYEMHICFCISYYASLNRDGRGGGARGARAPQVLGYQLTLFGPRGQIMPAI